MVENKCKISKQCEHHKPSKLCALFALDIKEMGFVISTVQLYRNPRGLIMPKCKNAVKKIVNKVIRELTTTCQKICLNKSDTNCKSCIYSNTANVFNYFKSRG